MNYLLRQYLVFHVLFYILIIRILIIKKMSVVPIGHHDYLSLRLLHQLEKLIFKQEISIHNHYFENMFYIHLGVPRKIIAQFF